MCRSRSWARGLLWVPIALLSLVGCQSNQRRFAPPPSKDDFGADLDRAPITEETVGATEMLHRRFQLSIQGSAVIPAPIAAKNEFEVGPSAGIKGEIETMKNFFMGLSFDWAHQTTGKTVDSTVDSPSDIALLETEPDQWYKSIDRFNFLALFDYDVPLAKDFLVPEKELVFRWGIGAGLTIIDGEEASEINASDIEMETYFGFVLRPEVGLRWQITEHGIFFIRVAYDFVYPQEVQIDYAGQTSTLDGDIDFSVLSCGAGLTVEF